jgi:hypothetical protein
MRHSLIPAQLHTLAGLIALIVLLASAPSFAAPETRQYQMSQRSGGDVAEQIRDLYPGDEVTVSSRGQQMTVRAEPFVLDEIGQLVRTMDVAPLQMRVTVRSRNTSMGKQGGNSRTVTTRNNQERSLVVQEGESAEITAGQVRTLPVAIRGGRNPAAFLQQVETRSGFIVSPRVISEKAVELNIVSFEEDPDSGVPGYETEALMTLRRAEPGKWVTLGGTRESQSSEQSGTVYQTGQNSRRADTWEIRVDLM